MAEAISHDARWQEYPGEDWSDALVQSMKLGGIDHLFFVSGSEIAFWQESIAKANERGWPAPKLITVTHEAVALNAALGSAMVRNQPPQFTSTSARSITAARFIRRGAATIRC